MIDISIEAVFADAEAGFIIECEGVEKWFGDF